MQLGRLKAEADADSTTEQRDGTRVTPDYQSPDYSMPPYQLYETILRVSANDPAIASLTQEMDLLEEE